MSLKKEGLTLANMFANLQDNAAMKGGGAKGWASSISESLNFSGGVGMVAKIGAGLVVAATAAKTLYEESRKYEKLNEKAQESYGKYSTTKEELSNLNSELSDTKAKIEELESSGTLSFVDQAELEKLKAQNSEMEKSVALKENQAKLEAKQAGIDASLAVKENNFKTQSDYDRDALLFGGINDENQLLASINTDKYTATAHSINKSGTVIDNVMSKIQKYKDIQQDIADAEWTMSTTESESEFEKQSKLVSRLTEELTSLTSEIDTTTGSLTANKQAMLESGDSSKYLKEIEGIVSVENAWGKATNTMTETESKLNAINTYFGDKVGQGLFDDLKKMAETQDIDQLTSSIESMGIAIDGVGSADIARYFSDMASSAEEAANSVEKLDTSMDGIGKAFESGNSGDNFVKMDEYLKQADELLKQGLTGTDEFKTVEKAITNGTGKDYHTARKDLERYFTTATDEDDKEYLSRDGIQNFANDYKNIGKEMKNTASAAKELGISTEMFEVLMGRVSDYDGFEDIEQSFKEMAKSSEQFQEATSYLEKLKELGKENGDENLLGKTDEWQKQLDGWEDDLSQLNPEIIVQMKLEYDLASIQAKIDELQNLINEGDASSKEYAALNSSKRTKRDIYESSNSNEAVIMPVEYQATSDTISNLQKQLKGATEEQKVEIQAEISNLYDVQNEFQDAFTQYQEANGVKITPEMDVTQAQEIYNNFLQTTEAQEIISKITADNSEALAAVAELLGVSVEDLNVAINLDMGDAYSQLSTLQDKISQLNNTPPLEVDATVKLNNEIDAIIADLQSRPVEVQAKLGIQGLSADEIKAQIGSGAIQVPVNPLISPLPALQPTTTKVDYTKGSQENPDKKEAKVDYKLGSQANPSSPKTSVVNYELGSVAKPGSVTVKVNYDTSGKPKFNGTMSGFAYGTLNSAFARGTNVSINKNQRALIGELGTEGLVRNGKLFLIGQHGASMMNLQRGDIIFNHKQMEELRKNGHVTSGGGRAKVYGEAFVHGTVGSSISSAFAGGIGSDFNGQRAWDGITTKLDRLDKALDKLVKSIEGSSNDLVKQNEISQRSIEQLKTNIAQNEEGARHWQFMQDRNTSVSDEWKEKIRNGQFNVQNLQGEGHDDLVRNLEAYQKYYEAMLECEEKALELTQQLAEYTMRKLDNIEKYYANRYDYNDNFGYANSTQETSKALKLLQEELAKQVADGNIKEFSNEWYEAQEKIANHMDKLLQLTWDRYQDVIDSVSHVVDQIKDAISLKDSRDEYISRKDYQKQVDAENKKIQANYNLRQQKVNQLSIYDVNSEKYRKLRDEIASLDSEVYSSLETIEDLRNKVFESEFFHFNKDIDKLDEFSSELDNLRKLLNDDAFIDKKGVLTAEGAANITLVAQSITNAKQKIADYTTGIKKLDGMLKSGLISTEEYEEKQKEFLSAIRDSSIEVDSLKDSLIDLYTNQMKKENDYLQDSITLRKKARQSMKEYYDYADSINDKSKDVNALQAQIKALEGVSNPQAMAEYKRLQAQLKDSQKDLNKTKKNHENDLINQGYDGMSDDLNKHLEDTLYEITMNSDKQQEIVSQMLNNIVGMYGEAYDKIGQIISDSGLVGSGNLNNTVNNIGSSAGASSIVNGANKPQGSVSSSNTANSINTNNIAGGGNNASIENSIGQEISTSNRKVAEVKLSKSSLALQEGQSGTLSVTVRPNDAKNKGMKWVSSNASVATVNNGTVRGIKAGSATISATTVDGSGITVTCGVTVKEKPKPAPKPPATNNNNGGDGVARVGDRVQFVEGKYFNDSYGKSPNGSRYMGQYVYITKINSKGSKPYHISTGGSLGQGDLGWLTLQQLRGYYTGTRNASSGLARIDDTSGGNLALGSEAIVTKHGVLRQMNAGDTVFNAEQVKTLYNFSKNALNSVMPEIGKFGKGVYNVQKQENTQNINLDIKEMIHIDGATPDVLGEIERKANKVADIISKPILRELKRL